MPSLPLLRFPDCTLAVLAGGRSERFGSDKARACFHGRTLLDGLLERFTAAFTEVRVVVDRPGRFPLPPDVGEVVDRLPACGPLGAIEAVLTAAGTTRVAVVPVDSPLLEPGVFEPLARALDAEHDAAAFVHRGLLLPFPSLFRREAARGPARALLEAHLEERRRDPARTQAPGPPRLLLRLRTVRVDLDDTLASGLADADTPEELARLQRRPVS